MAPGKDYGPRTTLADRWPAGWTWVLPALYQIPLLLAVLAAWLWGDLEPAQRVWAITLAASSAIWHWLSVVALQRDGPVDARLTAAALGVLAVMWYVLVLIDNAFYLLLLGVYSQIICFLPPRWLIAVAAAVTLLAGLSL